MYIYIYIFFPRPLMSVPFFFALEMLNKLSKESLLQQNRVFIHTLKEYCKKKKRQRRYLSQIQVWPCLFYVEDLFHSVNLVLLAEIAFLHLLASYLQLFRCLPILKLFISYLPILCCFHKSVCIVWLLVCLFLSQ